MLNKIKKIILVSVTLYVLLCIVLCFTYEISLNLLCKNTIIYDTNNANRCIVYLDNDKLNFIKVKDISFDILNLSKLPTIDERIVFDLITPKESFKIYNRKKFNLHNLEKSTENGILIRCDDDKNTYGFIETSYIYLGVSKNNVENIINLSESTNFQSELLYDKYYVFMFENEKHLEIEQLANFKFRY